MMSSNMAASNDASADTANSQYWVVRWSGWLSTIGAVFLAFAGIMTAAFSAITISLFCVIAGVLQVCAAGLILAIEGSSVVAFLTFAKPVGMMFENKPIWLKTAVYAGLTILPMLLGCGGFWLTLGFLDSAGITALYGMALIGKKAEMDQMRATATIPA